MGLKNDIWLLAHGDSIIHPFVPGSVSIVNNQRVISYGTSSYGYDMRLGPDFRIFTNYWPGIIDPKCFEESATCHKVTSDQFVIIPPNSFALARSYEYFAIPRGILCICLGKSTYARCGIVANITAFEPEWEGHVTIELSNTTPLPAKVYVGEGIAQVLFFEADEVCNVSYKDKAGKYQGQKGVTFPRV